MINTYDKPTREICRRREQDAKHLAENAHRVPSIVLTPFWLFLMHLFHAFIFHATSILQKTHPLYCAEIGDF